jgi:Tol biopolymer transport system component
MLFFVPPLRLCGFVVRLFQSDSKRMYKKVYPMSKQFFTQVAVLTLALLLGNLLAPMLYPQGVQAEHLGKPLSPARPDAEQADFAIAYVSPSRDNQQIRLINPDGSNDRLLWQTPPNTPRQDGIGELSWRSDASELAFDSSHDWQRSMNVRDIYSVAADGSRLRRLTRPPAASDTHAHPTGAVTFWLDSYAQGDVQLYIEGASAPISFVARLGYSYQITQTLADLGDGVRQFIRLYDPDGRSTQWCNYNEVAWVDVAPGQTTDAGRIRFLAADDYTCPQTIRPAWNHDSNELLYLYAEASTTSFQEESNLWQISSEAPPTTPGVRLLNYSQYLLEGRLFLARPGRSAETSSQLLAAVRQPAGASSIFRAPIADAGQREFFDLGDCSLSCEVAGLAWLPDGSGFIFSRYESRLTDNGIEVVSAIYRYTFDDHQVSTLFELPNLAIGRLDLSPDGSQIVFEVSNQLDETTDNYWLEPLLLCPCQLWIVNSDGANAHLLVNDGRAPVWSPAPLPRSAPPTLTPTVTPTVTPTATPIPPVGPGPANSVVYIPIVQK